MFEYSDIKITAIKENLSKEEKESMFYSNEWYFSERDALIVSLAEIVMVAVQKVGLMGDKYGQEDKL